MKNSIIKATSILLILVLAIAFTFSILFSLTEPRLGLIVWISIGILSALYLARQFLLYYKSEPKKFLKRTTLLTGIISIITCTYIFFIVSSYQLYFNRLHTTLIPQANFIEIRPVVYGWPTDEIYEAEKRGEIFFARTDAIPFYEKEYVIMVKWFSKDINDGNL